MIGEIVKLKNPISEYQEGLRYKVTKEYKKTFNCRSVEFDKASNEYIDVHVGNDYKSVRKELVVSVS